MTINTPLPRDMLTATVLNLPVNKVQNGKLITKRFQRSGIPFTPIEDPLC